MTTQHNTTKKALTLSILIGGVLFCIPTLTMATQHDSIGSGLSTLEIVGIISIIAGIPVVLGILVKVLNFKSWLTKDLLENQNTMKENQEKTNVTLNGVKTKLDTYVGEHDKKHYYPNQIP